MSAISATISLSSIGEKSFTIKEGYKKTKLGWIPEDWETPRIDEVFDFLSSNSLSRNQLNYEEEEGVYNIHYGDIHATYKRRILDFENESRVPKINKEIAISQTSDFLKDGDLVVADASEDYEGVGEAIELKNVNERKVISGLHTFAFRDKTNKTAEGFRVYIFRNPLVKKALKTIATGSKVYGISKGNLQKFKIVLPTLPEQQKIATILSTWDSVIAKQEQLIIAKQEFKKGLMQLLLTGKKRFEGFEGEWGSKTLNECCSVKGKYGINAAAVPYKTELPRYLRITDIDDSGNYSPEKEVSVDDPTWSEYVLEDGDIVFARTGNTTGKTYLYDSADGELVFAGFLIKFKPDPRKLNPYFLKYFTNSTAYWKWVEVMSVRSGQPGINSNEYGKLNIKLPSLTEQQKIASVLSAADKEIGLLQSELATLREQKRGLMQRLLTGEVRVEIN